MFLLLISLFFVLSWFVVYMTRFLRGLLFSGYVKHNVNYVKKRWRYKIFFLEEI